MPFLLLSMLAAPCVFAQAAGYWHTSGAQIVDTSGKPVRIAGVNWYGFETSDQIVHGLYSQDYVTILRTIKTLGYNTVRLPYSNQMVEHPIVPSSIGYANGSGAINTSLKRLTSLQIMDKVVQAAGSLGLKIILDNHRSEAGNGTEANGLWYTSSYPESAWIADWQTLAKRYSGAADPSGNPTVIGIDLRNEPHLFANGANGGSCWTGDTSVKGCSIAYAAQNWPAAATRAGNAVLAINPKLLIFVEGVDCFDGDCDFWGGNLEGAKSNPVHLSLADRLVYSAHDYGPVEYRQKWFNSSTTPASLDAVWTKFWGYLCINGTAPVWLGEFGTTNSTTDLENSAAGSQGQWFSSLVAYLGNHPAVNWSYWALNAEDSYGLLDSNYNPTPPSSLKQQLLSSIEANANSAGSIGCHVDYSISNQWTNGFQAAIIINNTGAIDINAWTLKWVFPGNQQVASLWNAGFTQSGDVVTATNVSYDGNIPASRKSQAIGFTANSTGRNAAPTNFTLNGITCR